MPDFNIHCLEKIETDKLKKLKTLKRPKFLAISDHAINDVANEKL